MAYTIYEYFNVSASGQPVEPADKRTASQALGSAVQLDSGTVYVAVVPDANMNLRISTVGTAATSADFALAAGNNYGFPVRTGSRPSLYGL